MSVITSLQKPSRRTTTSSRTSISKALLISLGLALLIRLGIDRIFFVDEDSSTSNNNEERPKSTLPRTTRGRYEEVAGGAAASGKDDETMKQQQQQNEEVSINMSSPSRRPTHKRIGGSGDDGSSSSFEAKDDSQQQDEINQSVDKTEQEEDEEEEPSPEDVYEPLPHFGRDGFFATWDGQGDTVPFISDYKERSSATSSFESPFCIEWNETIHNLSVDEWWIHEPLWDRGIENRTHQCFIRIDHKKQQDHATLVQQIYNINIASTNCEKVYPRYLWSSGWGADFWNIESGILDSLDRMEFGVPLILKTKFQEPWQYAETRDGRNKACEAADLSCYFIPYSKCNPHPYPWSSKYGASPDPTELMERYENPTSTTPDEYTTVQPYITYRRSDEVYRYMTRPKEWLRKAIAEFVEEQMPPWDLTDTCSVIHVRRSDVVLGGIADRAYHPIQQYLNYLTARERERIFLITDDQNAVKEALEFHSSSGSTAFSTTWHYIRRSRHSGNTGGYENQLPSNDPKMEVIVIMATNTLIQQCDTLVRTTGNFGNMLERSMREKHSALRVHMIEDDEGAQEFNEASVKRLNEYIEKKRNGEDVSDMIPAFFVPPSASPPT